MLSSLTRYARSFFTSAPISQEQAQAAKDTVEVSRLSEHSGDNQHRVVRTSSLTLWNCAESGGVSHSRVQQELLPVL